MTDDFELTPDEHLRALAALEAVSANDDAALAVLAAPGERPLPELLAVYGEHNLQRILLAAFGINAATGPDEMAELLAEMNSTQQARLAFILIGTLRQVADRAGGDLATAKIVGMAVLNAIGTFIDEGDAAVAVVLRALRQEVLKAE